RQAFAQSLVLELRQLLRLRRRRGLLHLSAEARAVAPAAADALPHGERFRPRPIGQGGPRRPGLVLPLPPEIPTEVEREFFSRCRLAPLGANPVLPLPNHRPHAEV